MPKVTLTEAQIRAGLLSGNFFAPAQFTFSFANASSTWTDYAAGEEHTLPGYAILSTAQVAAYRAATLAWDRLIAPSFAEIVETATARGEMRIAFTTMDAGTAGYAYQSNNRVPTSKAGDIWMQASDVNANFALGTQGYITLLHEIGHVLGLKHSFEAPVIPAPFENGRYTTLSYTQATPSTVKGFAANGNGITTTSSGPVIVITPMVLDIAAIQLQYGADTTTEAGTTTYTFIQSGLQIQAIYDAGGIDTIDLSAFTRNNIVDLTPGGYSSIGHWTIAEQTAFWQSQFDPFFSPFIAQQMSTGNNYEWVDNLGIALGTVIENVIGGSGNDTISGNDASNIFQLLHGGNDTVSGGSGSDGFVMGSALTAADVIDGGSGADDQLSIRGATYGAYTFSATNLTGIETLVVSSGSVTTFGGAASDRFSYNLTATNDSVAAGAKLTVNANTLLATENFTFNGAAETDGSFFFYGGQGLDTLTGGGGSDGFYFGASQQFRVTDVIDGRGGADDQLGLRGDYSAGLVFTATTMVGIESLVLLTVADTRFATGGTAFSYNVTLHNGNVAGGATLTVNANSLLVTETATVNGLAETDGAFRFFGGAGADTFIGGAGVDLFVGGLSADRLTGGGGNDVFAYRNTAQSTAAGGGIDRILDFTVGDLIDLATIDANTLIAGNDAFAFIGAAAFSGAGQLRTTFDVLNNYWLVEGDTDGNGVADLTIQVATTNFHSIATGDFIL